MAKRVIDDSTLTAVADKIRESAPVFSGASITPLEMPEKIGDVYDEGRQAQYNEFWNAYMNSLNGSWSQKEAFAGSGWNDNTFNPNKNFNPYNSKNCELFFKDSCISDLAGILKRNDVTFNFGGCTYFDDFAHVSQIKYFPVLDMSSAARLQNTFNYCTKMESIEKWIISSNGNQVFSNTFYNCTAFKNIVIEGVIGNNISFAWSPLTKDSITSVINALSSTTTGKTLTLKKTAVNAAFPWICTASVDNDTELVDVEENWEGVVWAMGIGDYAEIGEYVFISFADTNIVIRKDGDNYFEDVNEGSWTLMAHGTDLEDEWGSLIASKPNWTISLA